MLIDHSSDKDVWKDMKLITRAEESNSWMECMQELFKMYVDLIIAFMVSNYLKL